MSDDIVTEGQCITLFLTKDGSPGAVGRFEPNRLKNSTISCESEDGPHTVRSV
jgi:hypothetical protein